MGDLKKIDLETKWIPKSFIASICLTLSVMLILIPMQQNLFAQQDASTACVDAEQQAQSDITSSTWFIIGCLAGLVGYLIALSEPYPPATKLLGKSPEYVAMYTDCYRRKGKEIKSKNALYGMLTGYGCLAAFYIVAIVILTSESSSSSNF